MHLQKRFAIYFSIFWRNKIVLISIMSLLPFLAHAQRNPDIQLYYELLNRIELLEREIRQLRGDLELYQYRQQGQSQVSPQSLNQSEDYRALERRVEALERNINSSSNSSRQNQNQFDSNRSDSPSLNERAPVPQPQIAIRPTPQQQRYAAPSPTEQAAYNEAFNLLLEGRYERAIQEFRGFLDFYPNSALSGDAYYWLGESYYVIRDFGSAEQVFLTLGSRYPTSEKIPDTLLKLGYLYAETGATNEANQVLQKLIASYPDSQAANLAEKQLRLLR